MIDDPAYGPDVSCNGADLVIRQRGSASRGHGDAAHSTLRRDAGHTLNTLQLGASVKLGGSSHLTVRGTLADGEANGLARCVEGRLRIRVGDDIERERGVEHVSGERVRILTFAPR